MGQHSDRSGLAGLVGARQAESLTNPHGQRRHFHRSDLFPFLCGRKRRLSLTSVKARTGGHVRYKSHPARAYSCITPFATPSRTPNILSLGNRMHKKKKGSVFCTLPTLSRQDALTALQRCPT